MADDPLAGPVPLDPPDQDRTLAQYPAVTDTMHNVIIALMAMAALKGYVNSDTAQTIGGAIGLVMASALSSVHVHGIWTRLLDAVEAHRKK